MNTEGTQLLIWEPSIYRLELACMSCSNNIAPSTPFFIHSTDIKLLLPNPQGTDPYSVRCASCGLADFIQSEFGSLFRETIRNYKPEPEYGRDTPFMSSIRQIVREELKQILTEEAFDPHGPFSPDQEIPRP